MLEGETAQAGRDAIKVLIVDDQQFDAELQIRALRNAGVAIAVHVVDREPEYRAALRDFAPDVILCDFSFPDFDGLTALRIAREVVPDTPLIFVSGTISEERAVIAVRNGAVDYVLKSNLLRLPSAVVRAVDEAAEKRRRREAETNLASMRARLTTILGSIDSVVASMSLPDENVLYVSPAAERVYGRPAQEFMRRHELFYDVIHADDAQAAAKAREELFASGSYDLEFRVVRPDGTIRWVNQRAKLVYDDEGQPSRIDSVAIDITERMEHQQQMLRLSRIRDLLSMVNSAILRIDELSELFQEACRIATTVGGFHFAFAVLIDPTSRQPEMLAMVGALPPECVEILLQRADDAAATSGIVARTLRTGQPELLDLADSVEAFPHYWTLLGAGVEAVGSFPLIVDKSVVGALVLGSRDRGFFSDEEVELVRTLTNNLSFAVDLFAKRERVAYLSYYDPLTELPNRLLCHDRLSQEIAAATRRDGRIALLVFDLHGFAVVNTTLGEAVGDDLLRAVAARLRDEMGPNRVARIAGDRFAVIMRDLNDISDVTEMVGEDGLRVLAEPFIVGERSLRITARVGCAIFPDDGETADALFRGAETALQNAKATDTAFRLYSPAMNVRLVQRLDLEARLRRATAEEQFVLHYQPKVELASGRLMGLEALIRWRDPDRPDRLIPPAEFIGLLEETGLIVPVGRWALAEAAQQQARWRAQGLHAPRIAVNVSGVQLSRNGLIDDLLHASRNGSANGNVASAIDLEITESALMSNLSEIHGTLSAIRELGAQIAVDDFGTGYSSLAYLHQLPVNALKIDRTFIDGMTTDANKMSIVSTIISLSREMRIKVIAEGVETDEQAQLLKLMRCDEVQGYLIGRPVPPEELVGKLTGA